MGESFAIETARRMSLPVIVLDRAQVLLGDETRRIISLQIALEGEINRMKQTQDELETLRRSMEAQERNISTRQQELEAEIARYVS